MKALAVWFARGLGYLGSRVLVKSVARGLGGRPLWPGVSVLFALGFYGHRVNGALGLGGCRPRVFGVKGARELGH